MPKYSVAFRARARSLSCRVRHLLVACTALVAGCSESGTSSEAIAAYHAAANPVESTRIEAGIDAYYDYSLGMGEGMRANAAMNQALSDFLRGRTVRYHRVGDTREPVLISDMSSPQANLMNLNNFKEIGSTLSPVVDRAVAATTRQSVFVTDFEATSDASVLTPGAPKPHRIDTKAWAQPAFRRWLESGHRIDVFARRYRKPDWWFGADPTVMLDNWIYTIVFTPAAILHDQKAYAASVLAFLLEDHARRASTDERHFAYWAGDVEIAVRNDPTTGNANVTTPVLDVAVGGSRPGWDYHQFRAPALQEWASAPGDDQRILNGVSITPHLAFASAVALELNVTDVTQHVTALTEALAPAAPPDTVVDKETGRVRLIDPSTGSTFVPRRADASPRALPGLPTPGVLAFVQNAKTHEVGIKLDPAFNGVNATTVYRADVVVQRVTLKDDRDEATVLTLAYSGGFRVAALRESLRLALRDVATAMKGRVLHSSYVRFDP